MILIRLALHSFVYLWALATAVYLAGFVTNRYTFNSIDSGLQIPPREALVIDVLLLAPFALPHSLLARQWFKRLSWHKTIYLLITAFTLTVLFFKWEPIPQSVWFLPNAWYLNTIGYVGWLLALFSAVIMNHAYTFGWTRTTPPFHTPGPYARIRHPQMLGILIAFWCTADMTQGRLVFAAVMTVYILLALRWEERDLIHHHGEAYLQYRRRAGLLFPR
jgi:protein-S-isoprenylcysteine O-methyltransferase Ste14